MKDRKKIQRRRDANRASRIRRKIASGSATADEREFLARWDARKRRVGRAAAAPPPPKKTADPKRDDPAPTADPGRDPAPTDGTDTAPPPPPADRPAPPEPPPAVLGSTASGSGDWRDQYRAESIGREALCTQVADLYVGVMRRINRYIASCGERPWCDDQTIETVLRPACVMSADSLLPDDFSLEPYHTVVIGSSVALTQAAIVARRKKRAPGSAEPVGAKAGRDVDGSDASEREAVDAEIKATRDAEPPPTPDPTVVKERNASKDGVIA